MNTKKSLLKAGALGASTLALAAGAAGATAASASAAPVPAAFMSNTAAKGAVGSIELGSPLQYEVFALQGGRNHGEVDYTNFTYAEPGSGVYAPEAASIPLTFTYEGSPYAHTLNGASLKLTALSNDRLAFTGTGYYNASASDTWTINGQVNGSRLTATITYGAWNPGYAVVLTGRIARDGSVSGTAESSQDQALTFAMPAGSFPSVLSYTAKVQSEKVQGHNATFTFTIPRHEGSLTGVKVTVKVHDGGRLSRDTYVANGVRYPVLAGVMQIPER